MKKLTILSTIILAATFIMSCSKDSTFSRSTFAPAPSQAAPLTVKIAGPWFSPSFTIVNDRSSIYLMAHKDHGTTVNYDGGTHVVLAYVKMDYQGSVTVKRLPSVLECTNNLTISNKTCEINFGLNNTGCTITIKNADRDMVPSVILATPFPDLQIRYVIISNALFNSLNINWDDYAAVALALNI